MTSKDRAAARVTVRLVQQWELLSIVLVFIDFMPRVLLPATPPAGSWSQVSPDLRSADPKTISRGITVLSNSQSYVKSFDGMAYELKGKLKEGSSTSDIETVSSTRSEAS